MILARQLVFAPFLLAALAPLPTLAQVAVVAEASPPGSVEPIASFGTAVALSGETLAVGDPIWAWGSSSTLPQAGAAFVYERDATGAWQLTTTLESAQLDAGDDFGRALDLHGDWLAVGAPGDGVSTGTPHAGVVSLHERASAGTWALRAQLTAAQGVAGDGFGSALALRPGRVVVGAPFRNAGAFSAGAAYVFERDPSGAWPQVAELTAPAPVIASHFGVAVALSGTRALVGAPDAPFGKVYVFERNLLGTWAQVAVLEPADVQPFDRFGRAVALDGDRAYVGAQDHEVGGVKRGAVYVYERNALGAWTQTQQLDSGGGLAQQLFGFGLGVEGDELVVSAPFTPTGGVPVAGLAHRFLRGPGGAWSAAGTLSMPQPMPGGKYGVSIDLSAGRLAGGAIGAGEMGVPTGRAYVHDLAPLDASDSRLSLSQGGAISFELDAGFAHVGELALLLGSVSGAAPGQTIAPGVLLPLNPDAYFAYTLAQPNHAPLSGSLQVLGAGGATSATFTLPAGTPASLVGTTVHHAFATIALAIGEATFASNVRSLTLVP